MTTELFEHKNDRYIVDSPIQWSDGSKGWYQNDELHRVDGPAVEWPDGDTEWYIYGKCHRYYGPACDYSSESRKEWWLNDTFII